MSGRGCVLVEAAFLILRLLWEAQLWVAAAVVGIAVVIYLYREGAL